MRLQFTVYVAVSILAFEGMETAEAVRLSGFDNADFEDPEALAQAEYLYDEGDPYDLELCQTEGDDKKLDECTLKSISKGLEALEGKVSGYMPDHFDAPLTNSMGGLGMQPAMMPGMMNPAMMYGVDPITSHMLTRDLRMADLEHQDKMHRKQIAHLHKMSDGATDHANRMFDIEGGHAE